MGTMLRHAARIFIIVLILAVLAFIIGGMALPSSLHVEQTTVINAPAEKIFSEISDFKKWSTWSPWHEDDPAMLVQMQGEPGAVGSSMTWESGKHGTGRQIITASTGGRIMRTFLDFEKRGRSGTLWRLDPVSGGTQVTWSLDTEYGSNYAGRYMALYLRSYAETTFQRGLASLKAHCENTETPPAAKP